MSNVVDMKTGQPMERFAEILPQYAAMPAWVVGCHALNREVMDIQDLGWKVQVLPEGEIEAKHDTLSNGKWLNLVDAWKIQRVMEGAQ